MTQRRATERNPLRWIPATHPRLTVRGLAWFGENGGRFSRLPLRAQGRVRDEVWDLAQCPASARVAFRSDTTRLAVRVTNQDADIMDHMPATGSNGLALYSGAPGRMRPWATARPGLDSPAFESELFDNVTKKMREFRLYLPLYKAMTALELGLSKGARILPPAPPAISKPVVFYGTSITQGGCASTAGSDFVSTIGRRLNLDVINLGLSGNGRGELEVAELVNEIDASLYVLDYASNVDAKRLRWTLPRFVRTLRERHPETPILIVTVVCFSMFNYKKRSQDGLEALRDVAIEFYARQRRRGDRHIHLADGFGLLPFGIDCAFVDGLHPTDHGFHIISERLAPVIEQILLRDT